VLSCSIGSREKVSAVSYIYEIRFPQSGEALRDLPIFFHDVNVGPNAQDHEMIADVYAFMSNILKIFWLLQKERSGFSGNRWQLIDIK